MADLINDGSLIFFVPFNEASGAPYFANHSPARCKAPSGICFDFVVATAENANQDKLISLWPGTATIFDQASGAFRSGYMAQGYWKLGQNSSPYSKYLLLGNGASQVREQTLVPPVAQSGFTVGMWVYPNSDGYPTFQNDALLAVYTWEVEAARCHTLMGQFGNTQQTGWHLGVSGKLAGASQFASQRLGGPQQLVAFFTEDVNATPIVSLRTPLESGRFSHITASFRYINGVSNQMAIYKDGRLEASGTTSSSFTMDIANLINKGFGIGGGDDGSAPSNNFNGTCGWNHIVSGAYFFRRVLNEGEILNLHNQGGLQPAPDNRLSALPVSITDPALLAYYPFRSIGGADASKNHRPLTTSFDEGTATHFVVCPGPYRAGSVNQQGANSDFYVPTSGLIFDMLNGRSWTISAMAAPFNGNGRADNLVFSMGSVSATTTTSGPAAISAATFGMALTEIGVNPTTSRMRFSAYPFGDISASVFDVDIANSGFFNGAMNTYTVAYDDGTKGLAVYCNGFIQSSGTLTASLTDQLLRLANSGFPLLFTNGITDQVSTATTRGVHSLGGFSMFFGPVLIMGRALLPEEVRGIAQSGIDTTPLWKTPYDPRLMGYWPCSDFKLDDIIVEDRARIWDIYPANLIRSDTKTKWDRVYDFTQASVFGNDGNARVNLYGTRTTPPELASYGVLGITSGAFSAHGLSQGDGTVTNSVGLRSATTNLISRFRPVNEANNTFCQSILGEFITAYEVTPSGTIPATAFGLTADGTKFEFNSTLSLYGNLDGGGSNGELRSFLTTIDAPNGSGVTLMFMARAGAFATPANTVTLVSGTLPFGVPSKVLFHSKFESPYDTNGTAAGATPVTCSLWINGVRVQSRTLTSSTAKIWASTVNSASDDFMLEFGGEIGNDSHSTQTSRDGGLGDIYMREIFIMRGVFDNDEIHALAASGIQSPTLTGFTPTQTKTQVTKTDTALQGYWRFNGFDGGGSGTRDLSIKAHHLTPIAQQKNNTGGGNPSTLFFHFIPGPLSQSDLAVQCSGLSYVGHTTVTTPMYPPFAVSGTAFDSPQNGFSVGFLMAKRAEITSNRADCILAYGLLGSNSFASTTINLERGWAITTDVSNDIKMVMSVAGAGYYDNSAVAAQSGQIVCGTYEGTALYQDTKRFDLYKYGNPKPSKLDAWSHYCWTYDATTHDLICYVNGQETDRQNMKTGINPYTGGGNTILGPAVPANPASRMITFLQHQNASPWDFSASTLGDFNSVITDVFYFSRTLSQAEVKYIAFNGIDNTQITVASGIIGGYIQGLNTASGIIGGYLRGQNTASGIIGGFTTGSTACSGMVGGYVSGTIFAAGTIGGFVHGLDTGSGLFGGYIKGSAISSGLIGGYIKGLNRGSGLIGGYLVGVLGADGTIGGYIKGAGNASGIIGGFIIGGIQGSLQFDGGFTVQAIAAKDFDSQLQVSQTSNSDFDARVVVFQAETGPAVDIIIPHDTVNITTVPFNQYLIGAASGTQGKTITQTRWTFGDLTAPVSVSESGAGLFPIQHYFAGSGFYIVKFEAIDSNGIHSSATRIINAASGIDPVLISLSGIPRAGAAALTVDFTTKVEAAPTGVNVISSLINFDDGQTTITFNPVHVYTEPGSFRPVWCVRDSRGVFWCDSLEDGSNG
jgi:hypothetical protein